MFEAFLVIGDKFILWCRILAAYLSFRKNVLRKMYVSLSILLSSSTAICVAFLGGGGIVVGIGGFLGVLLLFLHLHIRTAFLTGAGACAQIADTVDFVLELLGAFSSLTFSWNRKGVDAITIVATAIP